MSRHLLKEYIRSALQEVDRLSLSGSRPEEHYQDATADNLLFNEPGMSVEPEVRSAIAAYLVKMGLMKPGPCKPKGPIRKARKA